MLKFPALTPLPTFESFVISRAGEFKPLDAKKLSDLLNGVCEGMNAARADAAQRHPDNPEQVGRDLFDWAREVLKGKLGRELDESEQALVRERCEN